MSLQLQQLRCFDAVSRQGSVRRAAAHLRLSQPAVSLHLHRLEQHLGLQLLNRSTRGTDLTDAGRAMLPRLRSVLQAVEAAEQEASAIAGAGTGRVRVGGVKSAVIDLLPEAIVRASATVPGLDVEITETTSGVVRQGVYDGTYELGVTAGQFEETPAGFVQEELARGGLMLVVNEGHPLLEAESIGRADIAALPLVTLNKQYSLRRLMLDYLRGLDFRIVCQVLNHDTIGRMVEAGVGVTVVPEVTYHILAAATPGLRARPIEDSDIVSYVWLLHTGDAASPASRALVEAIRGIAKHRLGNDGSLPRSELSS